MNPTVARHWSSKEKKLKKAPGRLGDDHVKLPSAEQEELTVVGSEARCLTHWMSLAYIIYIHASCMIAPPCHER